MSLQEDRRVRWTRLLADYQSSGLGVAEWCRRQGIHATSYYEWRRKLGEVPSPASAPEWLTVSPGANAGGGPVEQDRSVEACRIPESSCLTLRVGQVSIDLRSGFDRKLLRDALDVLESGSC
jgi:transposase-like protein